MDKQYIIGAEEAMSGFLRGKTGEDLKRDFLMFKAFMFKQRRLAWEEGAKAALLAEGYHENSQGVDDALAKNPWLNYDGHLLDPVDYAAR